jgi:hypothetical protein
VPERAINDVFDLKVAVQSLLNRAKGKTLKIGGEDKPHEAHSMLKMLAVGVGLPNPFAAEEQAAAELAAKKQRAPRRGNVKDAVAAAAGPGMPTTPQQPASGQAHGAARNPRHGKGPRSRPPRSAAAPCPANA